MHRIQKSHGFRSIRSSPRVIATRHPPPAPIHVASIPEETGGPKSDAAQSSRPEFTVIMTRSIQVNSFRGTKPKRTSNTTKSSKNTTQYTSGRPKCPDPLRTPNAPLPNCDNRCQQQHHKPPLQPDSTKNTHRPNLWDPQFTHAASQKGIAQ